MPAAVTISIAEIPEAPKAYDPLDAVPMPKKTYLRANVEFKKYGLSSNCNGCEMIRLKKPAQKHSEACRKRIEEAMANDPDEKARLDKT